MSSLDGMSISVLIFPDYGNRKCGGEYFASAMASDTARRFRELRTEMEMPVCYRLWSEIHGVFRESNK